MMFMYCIRICFHLKTNGCGLQKAIPFAVVGSNTVVEAGGKKIRGRMYPWGIVEGTQALYLIRLTVKVVNL